MDAADKLRDVIFSEGEGGDAADDPVVYPDNPDAAPDNFERIPRSPVGWAPVPTR